MASTRGRQVVIPLTNKSGGQVIAGDVVVVDTANNDAFTTTTSAGFTGAASVREAVIVGTLLAHPEMMAEFGEEAAELDFEDPDARALLSVLLACAAEDEHAAPERAGGAQDDGGGAGVKDRKCGVEPGRPDDPRGAAFADEVRVRCHGLRAREVDQRVERGQVRRSGDDRRSKAEAGQLPLVDHGEGSVRPRCWASSSTSGGERRLNDGSVRHGVLASSSAWP